MAQKKEKAKDLKGFSVAELRKQATALHEELFGMRLQNISGQLENTAKIRDLRRQVARIKTMITQKSAPAVK